MTATPNDETNNVDFKVTLTNLEPQAIFTSTKKISESHAQTLSAVEAKLEKLITDNPDLLEERIVGLSKLEAKNNPAEARTIAEEVQHIYLEMTGHSKEWWDSLSADYKRATFLSFVTALRDVVKTAVTQPGDLSAGVDITMSLFLFALTAVVLYPKSENPESKQLKH